jgi:hypothetical protein
MAEKQNVQVWQVRIVVPVDNMTVVATSTVLFHLQTDTDEHSVVDGTARRLNQTEERGRPRIHIHVGGGDP